MKNEDVVSHTKTVLFLQLCIHEMRFRCFFVVIMFAWSIENIFFSVVFNVKTMQYCLTLRLTSDLETVLLERQNNGEKKCRKMHKQQLQSQMRIQKDHCSTVGRIHELLTRNQGYCKKLSGCCIHRTCFTSQIYYIRRQRYGGVWTCLIKCFLHNGLTVHSVSFLLRPKQNKNLIKKTKR